ncbi:hypothetical protein SAMN04487967_1708 [Natronorubrum sediminis]|uniref:Envelope protein N-terminal domain-containing protein n=1 Tax=Natronorubrum sediminis TaxID=640943 RepID=A0A1H6FV43_9EURY|nr:hypothetical protein [Natronorubrum sediminis]SEH14659.1 hypothetical protein SAMN04487967_1708 [Natronorubrum sediminis]
MAASDSGPKPMPTAHEVKSGCSLPGRRRFLKQSAGAVATIATAGAASSTALADDDDEGDDLPQPGVGGSSPRHDLGDITSGISSLVGGIFGDDTDEIMEEEANELHDETYAYALDREPDDEDALDSMQANADLLSQEIYRNVSFVVAEQAEMGEDEDDVLDAAEDEIADTVANYQENLAQRWERHLTSIGNYYSLVEDEDELDLEDVFTGLDEDGSSVSGETVDALEEASRDDPRTDEITFVNGSQTDLPFGYSSGSTASDSNTTIHIKEEIYGDYESGDDGTTQVGVRNREDGGYATIFDYGHYMDVWEDLEDLYEDELEQAETIVDLLYDAIQDGEVDAHDIASGRDIAEAGEDMEHANHAAATFRAISLPEAQEQVAIEVGDTTAEGFLFWSNPSDDGLPVGETIDPGDEIGQFHAGLEIVDYPDVENGDDNGDDDNGNEVVVTQLSDEFEIIETEDGSDTVYFDEADLLEPDDDDNHEAYIEDLQNAYETREETREERQEVIIESQGVDLPGMPDVGEMGEGAGLLGLGLIGIVVLAVIGFVTDLIPGLGN